MRATIHHGNNLTCPSITLEGAKTCPGHTVEVPETMDDSMRSALILAVEFGFKAAERGENLEQCLSKARLLLFGEDV